MYAVRACIFYLKPVCILLLLLIVSCSIFKVSNKILIIVIAALFFLMSLQLSLFNPVPLALTV